MYQMDAKTFEPQYQVQLDTFETRGPVELGPTTSHLWRSDPRHLLFHLSRYKFCSKLLLGKKRVLEIGCGDGFASRIILQNVPYLHGVDIDKEFIGHAQRQSAREQLNAEYSCQDAKALSFSENFDGVISLDFIEHIPNQDEIAVIQSFTKYLNSDALVIFGTPNDSAKAHASIWSQEGHINLKTAETLKETFEKFFQNVLIFGMNDEVVHTGFTPMAHYLFAVCSGLKIRG